ncbi:MAG: hypothetical protein WA364_26650 [Candidatus Nitrosopolaris sp.]
MELEDILDKEIESWKGFEYALREENKTLFNKMLSNKEEYADCLGARGENFSTEVLFMILIYEQQQIINQLIARLAKEKSAA